MAEPFKNLISLDLVATLAAHISRVWPAFDARGFQHLAASGLEALELKARVMQLARALVASLPDDVDRAAGILESSLGPAGVGDDLGQLRTSSAGLAGWPVWPLTETITLLACAHHPERGLQALHAMTQRLSAEFAIRPFLVRHPALGFATLARWVHDPSPHVRRLVSEGSRPRLPWGLRLQALVADPGPTLPLLQALQDDPSPYVRRSVANHLNDIAKDHPAVIARWLAVHLPGASLERRALLRHASRTLVKQGDGLVLAAWGLGAAYRGRVTLALSSATVTIGDDLLLTVQLHGGTGSAQRLAIDYAVHHRKADGSARPKVFKGWLVELAPCESRLLAKRHAMKLITTRRYHPGHHALDLRINGQVVAEAGFTLKPA
jgi:3-methyladenine DNA glycosylase AlkC